MERGRVYRYALGLGTVAGGFMLLAALLFLPVPEQNKDILNIGLGVVLGWGAIIVGFEFGGSRKIGPQEVTVSNSAAEPVPVEATR